MARQYYVGLEFSDKAPRTSACRRAPSSWTPCVTHRRARAEGPREAVKRERGKGRGTETLRRQQKAGTIFLFWRARLWRRVRLPTQQRCRRGGTFRRQVPGRPRESLPRWLRRSVLPADRKGRGGRRSFRDSLARKLARRRRRPRRRQGPARHRQTPSRPSRRPSRHQRLRRPQSPSRRRAPRPRRRRRRAIPRSPLRALRRRRSARATASGSVCCRANAAA